MEVMPVAHPDRIVAYLAPGRLESPNWTPDGKGFVLNRDGHILRLPVESGKSETIDTGFATRNNPNHGISLDGSRLAISDESQGDHGSIIYTLPLAGGALQRVTKNSPSYWHGWSPDGKTIVFVGKRNDDTDIYSISASGGEETRLTTAKGLDDDPEYSPDGKYIYFNSIRSGMMQIWRMRPDGSDQEQVFEDDFNNCFPHISPDGKWMAFLSYDKGSTGRPPDKDVTLRLMSLADRKITVLAKLFGGQGTMNAPSWSPDSSRLAFVSYLLVPDEDFSAN
jgi:Tol biopolymer transport system component